MVNAISTAIAAAALVVMFVGLIILLRG